MWRIGTGGGFVLLGLLACEYLTCFCGKVGVIHRLLDVRWLFVGAMVVVCKLGHFGTIGETLQRVTDPVVHWPLTASPPP